MELKFYRVRYSLQGVFPQVETIDIFQRRVGPWDFLNSKELKSFCYNVKLKYQAKLKDVLGYYGHNGWGAMVSKRLRDILEEYNFGCRYQYINVSIVTRKGEPVSEVYYQLHIPMPGMVDKIDYPKSVFYVKKFDKRINDTPIEVKSYEDDVRLQKITSKQDVSALIEAEDIVLKKGTDPEQLDIFNFSGGSDGAPFLVSERLKQRLEQEKITGITFEEYPYKISIDE
ncbi:MAG: hypothetical protein IIX12_09795 [Alistipes sp.]|nr:hypothetical protein [Alistipes sp.]